MRVVPGHEFMQFRPLSNIFRSKQLKGPGLQGVRHEMLESLVGIVLDEGQTCT